MEPFMSILWLAGFVIALVVEAGCICLLSVWFAGGALVAMVAALLGAQIWLQVVLFFAVSIVLLALVRPLAKKHFLPKLEKTNADALVGATGLTTSAVDEDRGWVKVQGMDWSARSEHGPIPEGKHVRVEKIRGVKLYVTEQ